MRRSPIDDEHVAIARREARPPLRVDRVLVATAKHRRAPSNRGSALGGHAVFWHFPPLLPTYHPQGICIDLRCQYYRARNNVPARRRRPPATARVRKPTAYPTWWAKPLSCDRSPRVQQVAPGDAAAAECCHSDEGCAAGGEGGHRTRIRSLCARQLPPKGTRHERTEVRAQARCATRSRSPPPNRSQIPATMRWPQPRGAPEPTAQFFPLLAPGTSVSATPRISSSALACRVALTSTSAVLLLAFDSSGSAAKKNPPFGVVLPSAIRSGARAGCPAPWHPRHPEPWSRHHRSRKR